MRAQEISELLRAFSYERLTKYRAAYLGPMDPAGDYCGYGLYMWNSKLAAACFTSIHVMEVVLRNAVAEACAAQYGSNWAYQPGFHTSLKDTQYNELYDLTSGFGAVLPIGKIVSELNFFFWQSLLSNRHYQRLWRGRLFYIFPALQRAPKESDSLKKLYDSVEHVRNFRNRIAHHEPIFHRNISSDMNFIKGVIRARSIAVESWLTSFDDVQKVISERPI